MKYFMIVGQRNVTKKFLKSQGVDTKNIKTRRLSWRSLSKEPLLRLLKLHIDEVSTRWAVKKTGTGDGYWETWGDKHSAYSKELNLKVYEYGTHNCSLITSSSVVDLFTVKCALLLFNPSSEEWATVHFGLPEEYVEGLAAHFAMSDLEPELNKLMSQLRPKQPASIAPMDKLQWLTSMNGLRNGLEKLQLDYIAQSNIAIEQAVAALVVQPKDKE